MVVIVVVVVVVVPVVVKIKSDKIVLFVEVCASIRCTVHAARRYIIGLLQIPGATLFRLQKTEDAE